MKEDYKEIEKKYVCYCQRVTKEEIIAAIKQGCNTLDKIREETKACTMGNCKELNPSSKCCSGDILDLIKQYQVK